MENQFETGKRKSTKTLSFVEMECMTAGQVVQFFNCHIKTAQRYLNEIRAHYGMNKRAYVSNAVFAEYFGFSLEQIERFKQLQMK